MAVLCFPLTGCLSGNGYPDSYAQAYCGTLFACFESDSVEDMTGWDDVGDCKDEVASDLRSTGQYDSWEEGEASFDSDAAAACIEEVQEFRGDSDCAGESLSFLNFAAFLFDVADEACSSVYEQD